MSADRHGEFMQKAIEMAQEALDSGEVPIGCVIVDRESRSIVASGRNRTNEKRSACRHAELEAISSIDDPVNWTGMDLYVTVEPCIMCAAALRRIGLCSVYFGCYNERFGGCGSIMDAHTVDSVDPVLNVVMLQGYRKVCVEMLRLFYLQQNERAPSTQNKSRRIFKILED